MLNNSLRNERHPRLLNLRDDIKESCGTRCCLHKEIFPFSFAKLETEAKDLDLIESDFNNGELEDALFKESRDELGKFSTDDSLSDSMKKKTW